MYGKPLSSTLKFGLWRLRRQVWQVWQRYGESEPCQDRILHCLAKLSPAIQGDQQVQAILVELRQRVEQQPGQHHVIQLPEYRGWKMAFHALPQGLRIPPHAHPGTLILLWVMDGCAQVEQHSLDAVTPAGSQTPCRQNLHVGEGCVGLVLRHNVHAIQADASRLVFLSLRLSVWSQQTTFWQMLGRFLCGAGVALSAVGSTSLGACDVFNRKPQTDQQTGGATTEAAALYRESLQYLHGDGVPVDRGIATRLAHQAAKQGYQPAQKLYADLLNGIYDEVTGC